VKQLRLRISKEPKQAVTDIHFLNVLEIMSNIRTKCDVDTDPYICEICGKSMTEEDHNFCDICDECREEFDE
jgi:rubrerythrin